MRALNQWLHFGIMLLVRALGRGARRSPSSSALLLPSQATHNASPMMSVLLAEAMATRGLRTTRRGRSRAVTVQEIEPPKPVKRAPPPKPMPAVPAFIRVRDFAKILKRPLDDVLKHVITRSNRKLHMTDPEGNKFAFKNVKQVVMPFSMAQEVAAKMGQQIAFEDLEPCFFSPSAKRVEAAAADGESSGFLAMKRHPVIAVMGHVDHGKTTLMDTLRQSNIAKYEAHGITQKINVCETTLLASNELHATFLDTPGHFHFFRMRTNAAQVADLVLLIVAADEGVLLQTEESIGAIEDSGIPVIACINKVDVATREQIEAVVEDLRSFVALQKSPVVEISAKNALNMDGLKHKIAELVQAPAMQKKLTAYIGTDVSGQGLVLESIAEKGRGTVLRVLLKHGTLTKQEHFVAGMIHGIVRSVRNADGKELARAVPGMVVDVMYSNKSKNVDAPNESGFFVLPEAHAKRVIEQRQLALDFEENILPIGDNESRRKKSQNEDGEPPVPVVDEVEATESKKDEVSSNENDEDESNILSIIVKADTAGSLTSIQDTVDEMSGISTVRLGIGNISARDVDVAINSDCPIFGFNVKLRQREQKLAELRGVRVILRTTIHGLIEEVTAWKNKS